ncbi:MAG TPA: SRPBCC domain-containing protein [Thermoanaerobaculia bacterium]|jgi:uncharacterized protein YndB with AHSA1/START domain
MTDLLHRIAIQSPPDAVRRAVTTTEGFRSWWTDDCETVPEEGAVNVFRFHRGAVELRFRVDELSPGRVRWTCVPADRVPEEWVGTRIAFDLSPDGKGGTVLRLGHLGWRSSDGQLPDCNTVWGELLHRLKDYAEGRPRGPYVT